MDKKFTDLTTENYSEFLAAYEAAELVVTGFKNIISDKIDKYALIVHPEFSKNPYCYFNIWSYEDGMICVDYEDRETGHDGFRVSFEDLVDETKYQQIREKNELKRMEKSKKEKEAKEVKERAERLETFRKLQNEFGEN